MTKYNSIQSLIKQLLKKRNLELRFIIVGVWNTIFGYAAFFILDTLFEDFFTRRYVAYMLAMVIGQILAIINAFIFHKFITFKSKVRGKGLVMEFLRFCMTYSFTFLAGLVLLPFSVEAIGIPPRISAALIILVTTVISYFGHTFFSFKYYKNNP